MNAVTISNKEKSVKLKKWLGYIKIILLLFSAGIAAWALLVYSDSASNGARTGIQFCLDILVPSLFPFMILSTYLVKSGLSDVIGKVLSPITKFLFHLPGCTGATILMSMIGGYPVGARGIAALREKGSISEKESERMLYFCVNPGPAFVISIVGYGFLQSATAGIVLFFSQILGSILLGILCGISSRKQPISKPATKKLEIAPALIPSTADAARGCLNMCTFVILFAVLISLLRESGVAQWICLFLMRLKLAPAEAASLLPLLLEITGGSYDAATLGVSFAVIAFGIGWGGVCVHFQILSCVSKIHLSRTRFVFFRLLHGIIVALIADSIINFFPETAPVFNSTTKQLTGILSAPAPAAAALVLLCIVFLLSVTNTQQKDGSIIDECIPPKLLALKKVASNSKK